jgi:hypothetical protein
MSRVRHSIAFWRWGMPPLYWQQNDNFAGFSLSGENLVKTPNSTFFSQLTHLAEEINWSPMSQLPLLICYPISREDKKKRREPSRLAPFLFAHLWIR